MSLPANYKQVASSPGGGGAGVQGSGSAHMMSPGPASFNILKERLRASGSGGSERNKETAPPLFTHANHGNPAFTPQKTGKSSATVDSRAPKPPKPPEKPILPYMRYSKKIWDTVKANSPDLKLWEIGKKIAAMWKNLPNSEKQEFIDEFEIEKGVYQEVLKAYHSTVEYIAWNKYKTKQRANADTDVHETPSRSSSKQQDRRIDIQPAEDEEDQDDGYSFKHVAYARFLRNHRLINEIFSDAVVPDVRSVVTTQRMQVLKRQVTSLTMHQTKLEAELQQMEEKFEAKKRKLIESSEVFQEELKKHCKPAVDDETFQKMVERQYEAMKRERQRALDDPQHKLNKPDDEQPQNQPPSQGASYAPHSLMNQHKSPCVSPQQPQRHLQTSQDQNLPQEPQQHYPSPQHQSTPATQPHQLAPATQQHQPAVLSPQIPPTLQQQPQLEPEPMDIEIPTKSQQQPPPILAPVPTPPPPVVTAPTPTKPEKSKKKDGESKSKKSQKSNDHHHDHEKVTHKTTAKERAAAAVAAAAAEKAAEASAHGPPTHGPLSHQPHQPGQQNLTVGDGPPPSVGSPGHPSSGGPPPPQHHGPPPSSHHLPPHMPPHQGIPGHQVHPGLSHSPYAGYPPPSGGGPPRSPYYPPQYAGHPPQPYGQYPPYPYHQYGPPPPSHYHRPPPGPPMHYGASEHAAAGGGPPPPQQAIQPPSQHGPPPQVMEGHHPGGYGPPILPPNTAGAGPAATPPPPSEGDLKRENEVSADPEKKDGE